MTYPPKPISESLPVRLEEYQHEITEYSKRYFPKQDIIEPLSTIEGLTAMLKAIAIRKEDESEEVRKIRLSLVGKIFVNLIDFAQRNNINFHDTAYWTWFDYKRDDPENPYKNYSSDRNTYITNYK